MVNILCIDDEPDTHDYLNLILPKNCNLSSIRNQAGLAGIEALNPDLVFLDIDFCQGIGRKLLSQVYSWLHPTPIIVHSHSQSASEVVQCLRQGAADFIAKPISRQCLLAKLGSYNLYGTTPGTYKNEIDLILGYGKAATTFRSIMARFHAPGRCCLISAPSGVGKYPLAKALHEQAFNEPLTTQQIALGNNFRTWSPRGKMAKSQERELFGDDDKKAITGILEGLNFGTLYLEDLEYLDLSIQLRLSRVLARGQGAFGRQSRDVPLKFRLIASTGRNPLDLKRENLLDDELQRALFAFRVVVPSLRQRKSELAALAWHFLEKLRERSPGLQCCRISVPALEKLASHSWPGNLMELRQCITEACIRAKAEELLAEDIFFSSFPI